MSSATYFFPPICLKVFGELVFLANDRGAVLRYYKNLSRGFLPENLR